MAESEGFDTSGHKPAVSPCVGVSRAGQPLKNHALLLNISAKERSKCKEKRANYKTCLIICSLLYTVIFNA